MLSESSIPAATPAAPPLPPPSLPPASPRLQQPTRQDQAAGLTRMPPSSQYVSTIIAGGQCFLHVVTLVSIPEH